VCIQFRAGWQINKVARRALDYDRCIPEHPLQTASPATEPRELRARWKGGLVACRQLAVWYCCGLQEVELGEFERFGCPAVRARALEAVVLALAAISLPRVRPATLLRKSMLRA